MKLIWLKYKISFLQCDTCPSCKRSLHKHLSIFLSFISNFLSTSCKWIAPAKRRARQFASHACRAGSLSAHSWPFYQCARSGSPACDKQLPTISQAGVLLCARCEGTLESCQKGCFPRSENLHSGRKYISQPTTTTIHFGAVWRVVSAAMLP